MKKLGKKMNAVVQSVESYVCDCGRDCDDNCYYVCIKVGGDYAEYQNNKSDHFTYEVNDHFAK